MKNFGKQKQFTQGTGFGYQTTVGFYTQKIHAGLFGVRGELPRNRCHYMVST